MSWQPGLGLVLTRDESRWFWYGWWNEVYWIMSECFCVDVVWNDTCAHVASSHVFLSLWLLLLHSRGSCFMTYGISFSHFVSGKMLIHPVGLLEEKSHPPPILDLGTEFLGLPTSSPHGQSMQKISWTWAPLGPRRNVLCLQPTFFGPTVSRGQQSL